MSNIGEEENLSIPEVSISNHQENFENSLRVEIYNWILVGSLILSVVCLVLYMMAYAKIHELRKHSGKCLVSLCIAFLFEFICAIFIVKVIVADSNFCIPVAWLTYYFSMANNLWMCLIGFDMWRRLRGATFTSTIHSKRFATYSIAAWLLPFLALIGVIVIDITRPSFVPQCFIPEVGQIFHVCWFNQVCAERLYYFGPILLLLSVSTFFLIWSFFTISTRDMSEATTLAKFAEQIQLKPFAVLVSLAFIARIGELINMFLVIRNIINLFGFATKLLKSILGICFFIGFTCTGNARTAVSAYMSKGSTQPGHSDHPDYHPINRPLDEIEMEVEPTS